MVQDGAADGDVDLGTLPTVAAGTSSAGAGEQCRAVRPRQGRLLLFLNEPTSRLDSRTAWSICTHLFKLANNGQAIPCTIHQPSAMFQSLFLCHYRPESSTSEETNGVTLSTAGDPAPDTSVTNAASTSSTTTIPTATIPTATTSAANVPNATGIANDNEDEAEPSSAATRPSNKSLGKRKRGVTFSDVDSFMPSTTDSDESEHADTDGEELISLTRAQLKEVLAQRTSKALSRAANSSRRRRRRPDSDSDEDFDSKSYNDYLHIYQ